MLFWKMIDLNKVSQYGTQRTSFDLSLQRFRAFLSESGKTSDIVGYIVLCCLELKDNPGKYCLSCLISVGTQASLVSTTWSAPHAVVHSSGLVCGQNVRSCPQ